MSLLSPSRLEAIRRIRKQLCCILCGNIFQDPQCLDCKHNFCRPCILLHLKNNHSHCPTCHLPTRPSEVTRNQFLESILLAWKAVETELEALNGDPTLHATIITVSDTNQAFHRAANGTGTIRKSDTSEEKNALRGRVANHKWHIDTQEIRHELKLEVPYLPQHYGARATGSANQGKKTSSSDLPGDYGGTSGGNDEKTSKRQRPTNLLTEGKGKKNLFMAAFEEMSGLKDRESDEEETKAGDSFVSPSSNTLMATQEVESYMDRISKQREALSQWERAQQQKKSEGNPSLLDLERSLHCRNEFDEFVQERRRAAQALDEPDELMTQMTQMTQLPPPTSVLESPDLLAAFRTQLQTEQKTENQPDIPVKRRILSTSPSSGKRCRVSTSKSLLSMNGYNPAIDLAQNTIEKDKEDKEQTDRGKEEKETVEDDEKEEAEEEEEYELKPAFPLPLLAPHDRSSDECKRLRDLFTRKQERADEDGFQLKDRDSRCNLQSLSVSKPSAGGQKQNDRLKATNTGMLKPPVYACKSKPLSDSTFVFVSSDLTRDEVKQVLKATQVLGGKFGHDFDLKRDPLTGHFSTSVTHLITKSVTPIGAIKETVSNELRCKRTAKYMRGLAEGCFIVDFSWIKASFEAGRWIREEPFEIIGDIYSDASGKPQEGRLRRIQTGRRNSIFSLFRFVLLVSEKEFEFQFASVRHVVNNFGGVVVYAENFTKMDPKQRSRRTPVGVVSKSTLPSDAKAKWHEFQIPIVRITWIFDSVSHLEVLPFDDYYPY